MTPDTIKRPVHPALRWLAIGSASLLALTVLVTCLARSREPAGPPTPPYAGPTFSFSEAEVVSRISKVVGDFPDQPNELFTHADGLACSSREAAGGKWSICSAPNGNVQHLSYAVTSGGDPDAMLVNRSAIDGLMAVASTEPYTDSDRNRIYAEIQDEVLAQRSVIEQSETPKFVFMDIHAVRVQVTGSSYELLMQAGLEPH